MADDTEDQAVPAGVELQKPTVAINHGRAMGFSQRGNAVPQGTDLSASEETAAPEPQVATSESLPAESFNPQSDVARAPDDKQARYAAARAKVNQQAQAAYQDAYSRSQPVNPNGPVVQPLAYRQAEQQSDAEYQQAQVEQRRQRMIQNQQAQQQAQATGQKMSRDAQGNLVPELEPRTNRPLYHATPWSVGKDPRTGEPALTMIDQYGQRQFKAPKVVSSPDLTDNQLYYQMPDGTQQPAGNIEDLTKHPNFTIARQAMQAARNRRSAIWKEATAPLEDVAAQASTSYDLAKQRNDDLQTQADQLQERLGSYSENQLNETQGGFAGFGSSPTPNAQKAQTEKAALESQLGQIQAEQAKIAEQLKPGGQLYRSQQQAKLDLAVFKAKAAHDNYVDLANERRAILRSQGKSEANDPTLQSILQAQQTYGAAISRYGSVMQKTANVPDYAKPAPSGAAPGTTPTPISPASVTPPNATGERLPLGAPVPGKPGVFESVHGTPHLNDPAAGEPAAPSKFTLASEPQAQPEATAAAQPTPNAPTAQPTDQTAQAASNVAPSSELASEPFALAQKGQKAVGGVSVQELARRYGAGQGDVSPQSLIKLKQRSGEITDMLANTGTQLDGKVVNSLQQEKDYLDALYTQRFARLPVDAQNRVTELTREPTLLDKAKGAVKSGAEAAAAGGAQALKGLQLLADVLPVQTTDEFGQRTPGGQKEAQRRAAMTPAQRLEDIKQGPAYQLGTFIQDAAKDTYAKNPHENEGVISQALNAAAEAAGGFAPLVASGPAAPLTIGLQTAGSELESTYQDRIAKGEKPNDAANYAIKRALLSGALQSAIFEVLPKPLQKLADKVIVNRLAKGALSRFLANRVAQAGEGATLGATSAVASNLATGKPATENLGASAGGLALAQAVMPRAAPRKPGEAPPPDLSTPPDNQRLAPPEPFTPTGEGLPKTAKESAEVLAPGADKEAAAAAAQRPAPIKSAEESALAIKAQAELSRRAAAKEERAQKIVDDIQQTTGKSRGEILATREGKPIDDWLKELDQEAKYQKNPLVVDPERRSNELREQIKQSDADWQKHLDKLAEDSEAAAQGDQTKAAALERFNQLKSDALTRHEELRTRREAIENELTAAERLKQSPSGAEKLKADLKDQEAKAEAESRKLRTPELEERRNAIEQGLTEAERLRQSPEGAAKLKEDLAAKAKGETQPEPKTETPKAEPAPEAKEDPVADRKRYEDIQVELRRLTKEGKTFDDPEVAALFKENEQLKNRNSSDPGMPPEPISEPKTQPKETTVPDYDPENIGAKERINRRMNENGGDRSEAVKYNADRTEETRQWFRDNVKDGDLWTDKNGITWKFSVTENPIRGKEIVPEHADGKSGTIGDWSSLRGAKKEGNIFDKKVSTENSKPKETTNAVQKPSSGEAPIRQTPENRQGVRRENPVNQGAPAARQPNEGGKPAPRGEGKPVVRAEGNEARPAGSEGKPDAGQKGEAPVRAEVEPTEGFKKLNPLAQKRFNTAYDAKNARLMAEYLDPQNPSFRAEFEHRTGVKLPKTIGGTDKAVADHFAGGEKAASAGEQKATPQPSGKAATETAPSKEERQGSGEKKVEPVSKKGKRISVGQHPITGDDILNHIEQNGGVQTKSGASRPGGEHDDLGSSFSGVARLLLRKDGVEPDKMAQILHEEGLIPDGSVATMNAAVERAVRSRQMARRAVGAQEYGQKFEQAFLGNEPSKKWLKSDKPISVDDLVAGDKFEVNGEKFEVKDVDENGNVTIKDGITKEVPAGTPIYPDKGKIQKAKRSKDFIPKSKSEDKPLELESATLEQQANEAQEAREKAKIETQKEAIKTGAEKPLTGDSSNVGQGALLSEDSDLFSGESQQDKMKRAAESKGPSTTDKIISALQNAKINKPGEGRVLSSDPISLAYDAALDTAIMGIKAGRSLAHMIQLALTRFRAAYPKATRADEARLEQAIREAHGSAGEAKPESKPEAQAQKKAADVLSSPKVEETRNTLADRWNKAAKRADLKQTLAYTRDVADNQAGNTAMETRQTVTNELARNVPKADLPLAEDALGFHIEAGKAGRKGLAEMKAKIEASEKANPKWKARAIEAIDYADKHYDDLKSTADLYRQFTDQQVAQEQAAGMPTLKRDDYVMHAQDVDEGGWLDRGGGMSPTGASSRKNRVYDTHADSIAAGIDPKTLNAVDLLQTRVKNGQTGINLREWQKSLHNYTDPATQEPIAIPSPREERADGSYYYQPPKGYENEFLNGTPISVKKEYAGVIGALTDPSWLSKTKTRRLIQKLNGAGKSINLLIDTFHLGRLALRQSFLKGASLSDFRVPLPSYNDGRLILEHSADELSKMAKNGEVSPEALPDLLEKKKNLNLLTSAGLNTGHIADAMHQELVRAIPGIGDINKFIFEKFQRGAMSEAALMEFERQSKMYPDLKPSEVARKVSKDINTLFGNLGRQGIFKSRTALDIARLIWLAPQWNEGLIRTELGGISQIGTGIKDAVMGRRFAMGAIGRQMIAGTLGIFAANQLINQYTRGKFTWENPEEGWGTKLSAWIPDRVGGKGAGYFLNPLGVTAEISHLLLNNYERTESGWKTAINFLRSRASAISRPAWTAATGETALGAKIKPADMTKEVAKSAVPVPIGGESAYKAVRGAMTSGNTETYPGQFQKQAMSSMGLKTDTAPSPEQRIGKLARDFNKTKKIEPAAEFYAGDYTDLDNALRRDNAQDIKDELDAVLKKRSAKQVEQHYKSWSNHPFTGQRTREAEFIRTLNPEQKRTYLQAKKNRLEVGGRALNAINRLPPSVRLQPVNN